MFDFEDDYEKRKEKLEEEKFQELYKKQARVAKIILLSTFLPIGLIFLIVGIFIWSIDPAFIVFIILGSIFMLVGILLYFCMPRKGNYTRYKRNLQRFGGMNTNNMFIRIGLLEERVKTLEQENQELKSQLKTLDRKITR